MSETYDVYPVTAHGSDEEARESQPGQPWQVMVEYSNGGDRKPPTLVKFVKGDFATRAVAIAAAERHAFEFDPPDPFSPRGRTVYRDGDGFLTVIEGAMSTFHFTTRVVQLVGEP